MPSPTTVVMAAVVVVCLAVGLARARRRQRRDDVSPAAIRRALKGHDAERGW